MKSQGAEEGTTKRRGTHESLLRSLNAEAKKIEVYSYEDSPEDETPIRELRRRRLRRVEDPTTMLTLTEVDGVLQWNEGGASRAGGGRRRRRARGGPRGEIVTQMRFKKLEPNKIGAFLTDFDLKRTPHQGLRKLSRNAWKPTTAPRSKGPTLLFVHGTFSNNDHTLEELQSTSQGRAYLKAAAKQYDEILAFDHPTLSTSPILNALDLARLFERTTVPVDVVAHSRGGLVVRWWLETFAGAERGDRRAVLVGCPLHGTSLAAPPRLRASLSLLTNFGRALQLAGQSATAFAPFFAVPVALLKVATSITSLTAKTPLVDAAVAMVPGLSGQSRVSNNFELDRLRSGTPIAGLEYFVVQSNFEPDRPGWAFWRHFRKANLADRGADFLFEDANDLVVDTASMSAFRDDPFPADHIHDFGTNPVVHHVNYFEQPETIAFLRDVLA